MRLSGKVAVITGAGSGIGKATAILFAREGAKVVVNGRDPRKIDDVAAEISRAGGTAVAVKADVSKRSEVAYLARSTIEMFKEAHILVNNAGVGHLTPILQLKEEELDEMYSINVKGVLNGIQAFAPLMIPRGNGKIINIASMYGLKAYDGAAGYGASKAAVINLSGVAARELGRHGINVNAIAPGLIVTELVSKARTPEQVEQAIERYKRVSVLGRVGRPEDVANAALFLASEESNFVTGQVLCPEGGRTDYMV